MNCVAKTFFNFVIWCCENGSYVEGTEVWAERAPICDNVGGDDEDGGFMIENFVYWSLVLMICVCLLRAFVYYYLFCRW